MIFHLELKGTESVLLMFETDQREKIHRSSKFQIRCCCSFFRAFLVNFFKCTKWKNNLVLIESRDGWKFILFSISKSYFKLQWHTFLARIYSFNFRNYQISIATRVRWDQGKRGWREFVRIIWRCIFCWVYGTIRSSDTTCR